MPEITDAELDAATDAYVAQRWPVKEWRDAYPQVWAETRERMRGALIAAAMVRANG